MAETTLLKDYLEKLLDQANAPVVVINRERRITVFNQASERHTGYSRAQLLGKDLLGLFLEEEKEQLTPLLMRVMLGEQRSAVEVRVPHADGRREARIVFNMAPILSGEDELDGVILVGQDLTEIRNLQKQIIHTEKLATVGQIAAGVAHEVSNPLTSISVYANYLEKKLEGVIEESDTEKIKRIVEASARIQSFTRELVAYGRPSREKAVLLEVRSLLEWAISFCEHLIDRAGAQIDLEVEAGLKRILGIRGNLEQVFVNLIANACHAIQGAGGTIRFDAKSLDSKWITIAVSDTGHGIRADRLDKIFEPFYSTKPEGLGTGLGLSIVRNILTDHNAEIEVKSAPGKWTTFTLKFPVK
jgi:PAS domain S-box-containing protein